MLDLNISCHYCDVPLQFKDAKIVDSEVACIECFSASSELFKKLTEILDEELDALAKDINHCSICGAVLQECVITNGYQVICTLCFFLDNF